MSELRLPSPLESRSQPSNVPTKPTRERAPVTASATALLPHNTTRASETIFREPKACLPTPEGSNRGAKNQRGSPHARRTHNFGGRLRGKASSVDREKVVRSGPARKCEGTQSSEAPRGKRSRGKDARGIPIVKATSRSPKPHRRRKYIRKTGRAPSERITGVGNVDKESGLQHLQEPSGDASALDGHTLAINGNKSAPIGDTSALNGNTSDLKSDPPAPNSDVRALNGDASALDGSNQYIDAGFSGQDTSDHGNKARDLQPSQSQLPRTDSQGDSITTSSLKDCSAKRRKNSDGSGQGSSATVVESGKEVYESKLNASSTANGDDPTDHKTKSTGSTASKMSIPESPPRKRRKLTQLEMQNTLTKQAATLQMFLGKDQPNGDPINVICRIIRLEDGGKIMCSGNGGVYVSETISDNNMRALVEGPDVIDLINKLLKTDTGFAKKWRIRFSNAQDKNVVWKCIVDILEEKERQWRIEAEKEQKQYERRQHIELINSFMHA